jgi:tripartite-type tricarboxylate transporter receptor subunit TctC
MNHSTRRGERRAPRRRVLAAFLVAATALVPALAAAQAWPTKAVRIIVPFPPGGAADASARVLGEVMAKSIGQPVVVENRPGAGSIVGTQAAAQSTDGHTLLMGSTSMTILPALRHDLAYDVQRDFQPIGMVSAQPLVLAVAAASPIKTLDDVIARGKKGDLTSGNSGNGTLSHLTTELFNLKMGTKIVSVPYKGENALVPDIVGGTIAMGFVNLPSALPLLKAGRLRAIAVTSAGPVAEVPGVRTLKAAGMQEGVIEGWAALFAAKDVPAAGVQRMEQALRQALADPTVKERLASLGVEPRPGTQAQLRDYVKSETARWGDVVRSRNIKLD